MIINSFKTIDAFFRKFGKKPYKITPKGQQQSHFGDYLQNTTKAVPAGHVAMRRSRRYA